MTTRGPYPGLRPFERDEDDLFFGREEQVDQLLDKLDDTHFLAVLGVSGSGKSSLVRAGLLPALDTGFMGSAGASWDIAEVRPGDRPFHRLAAALIEGTEWGCAYSLSADADSAQPRRADERSTSTTAAEFVPPLPGASRSPAIAALEQDLRSGSMALNWRLGVQPLPEGMRLLILVDQFEELFRYHRSNRQEAAAFVALLLAAATHPDVYLVITLRSEFLGDCSLYPDLPEAINRGLFLTPALTPEQMADAIQLPAELPQFGGSVEPELVRRLLEEARGQMDQLPLLQHTLMRLWDLDDGDNVLTLAELEALGGLRKALDAHVEEAFAELKRDLEGEQQRIAEVLFRGLTERGSAERDTRRPVRLGEIAALAGVDWKQVAAVVEVFRRPGRSFLMPPAGTDLTGDSTLDITHEALIRQWRRLAGWTANEAEQAELYLRLESAAQRHREGKGALWIDPDLQIVLQWRDEHKPTKLWAERYGGDFDLAMGFLEAGLKKRERDAVTAEQQRLERTRELFDSRLTHASLLTRVRDYAEARQVLRKTAELDKDIPEDRRHTRNLLAGYVDIMGGRADRVYEGAGAQLSGGVAVSPDGHWLAAAGERGTLVLFDAGSGDLVRRLEGHDPRASSTGDCRSAVFDPEGRFLYSGGDDGRIIRWSVPDGGKLAEWEAPDQVWALATSPDGRVLASGGTDDAITLWSSATGERLRPLEGHTGAIAGPNGLAFSPDGKRLASASFDKTARIWDVETGKTLHTLRGHNAELQAVAFDPVGKLVATASVDKRIVLWDAETGQPVGLLAGHDNIVFGVAFDADGGRLLSASRDNTMRLWDVATGVTLRVYQGHTAGLWAVARHGDTLYTAANDQTVRGWSLDTPGQWVWELPGEPFSAAVAPDGGLVAVGFADGSLRAYAPSAGKAVGWAEARSPSSPGVEPGAAPDGGLRSAQPTLLTAVGDAHGYGGIKRMAFNAEGTTLATAGMDGMAKPWRVERNADGIALTLIHTLEGHTDVVHAVAFSPDGRTLATASYDGRVGLFDVETGEGDFFEPHGGEDVNSVSYAQTGNLLLTEGDWDMRLWDLTKQPPEPREVAKAQDKLLWATLRPDGRQLAAVGREYVVALHDLGPEPAEPRRLVGHENTVLRAIYGPDGRQLATVSADMTVRLWDLESYKELFVLRLPTEFRHPSPLWDFDFRCTPAGECWIAVPLTMGRLALYRLPYLQPPESLR